MPWDIKTCPLPPADGLISYSAPEGQLMMPPGYPIASLNDSTYDGAHERRPVTHTHPSHTSVFFISLLPSVTDSCVIQ